VPPSFMSALLITGFIWWKTNVLTPQGKDMYLVLGPEFGHRPPIKTYHTPPPAVSFFIRFLFAGAHPEMVVGARVQGGRRVTFLDGHGSGPVVRIDAHIIQ
jgi:hypothetical protein